MTDLAIQVDRVWKKFRKGEMHDSLRDLIPAVCRRIIGRGPVADQLAQREFWALKDVSFSLPKGKSLGIIGPNGAGKSTMLKLLSRIIKPNRGSYQVHGRLSALIEVGAGFHPDLTGRENIYLNGVILGMTRKEISAKEDRIIDFAGVAEFIDTPIKRYSSGMMARLGFSVAAHMDPEILLIDEVLSVGDARFRDKCIRHMNSLLKSGISVVFISHVLDQVRSLCPNTLVLDHGQVKFNGPTDQAIDIYMDLLAAQDHSDQGQTDQPREVEITNIHLTDAQGRETLQWNVDQPAGIEFELRLSRPFPLVQVGINFFTSNGVYLGTINSGHQQPSLVSTTGLHQVAFHIDPMILNHGDYLYDLQVFCVDPPKPYHCVWGMRHKLNLPVRGGEAPGGFLSIKGQWKVLPVDQLSLSTR